MKISIALYDSDKNYAERFQKYFQMNYSGKISISAFSEEEVFLEKISEQYFVYALIATASAAFLNRIPERVSYALLLPDNSVEEVKGIPVVGKYQSMDNIYRRIMELSAKKVPETKLSYDEKSARTVLFTSTQGGSGVTVCAAAYAVGLASKGKKVFFIDLNNIQVSGRIFGSEGRGTFSDVIFAMKSGETNFQLAIESLVHSDSSGVCFFRECARSQDILELTDAEMQELMDTLRYSKVFEYIVIDCSADFSERQRKLITEIAESVVYVCAPTETGRFCFERFYEMISFVEKREKIRIKDKTALLYNMYNRQIGNTRIPEAPVMVMGTIPAIPMNDIRELVSAVSELEVMDSN